MRQNSGFFLFHFYHVQLNLMFLEMAKGESELDMEGLTQEVDIAAQMILEPSTFSPDRKDSDDESDMSSDGDME